MLRDIICTVFSIWKGMSALNLFNWLVFKQHQVENHYKTELQKKESKGEKDENNTATLIWKRPKKWCAC